jgi:hypothetical protein
MTVEIPLKRKYKPQAKLYGYRRQHNGNGNRKTKKTISLPSVYSYDREMHVLQVDGGTGHSVMRHLTAKG